MANFWERAAHLVDCMVSLFGLNIFIQINIHKHKNIHYITMVYDGIQKEAIRLMWIFSP